MDDQSQVLLTQLTNQHIVLSEGVQGEVNWMVSVVDPHVQSLEKCWVRYC